MQLNTLHRYYWAFDIDSILRGVRLEHLHIVMWLYIYVTQGRKIREAHFTYLYFVYVYAHESREESSAVSAWLTDWSLLVVNRTMYNIRQFISQKRQELDWTPLYVRAHKNMKI